jgi:hypothetical protein
MTKYNIHVFLNEIAAFGSGKHFRRARPRDFFLTDRNRRAK